MDIGNIVAEIDAKIASLQHVREVLVSLDTSPIHAITDKPRRGRPPGSSKNVKGRTYTNTAAPLARKRTGTISPEGRRRIAEAQKLRWAERRGDAPKAAEKKEPAKKK
jgi:hypothetical protein